jgi:hypothetical protein
MATHLRGSSKMVRYMNLLEMARRIITVVIVRMRYQHQNLLPRAAEILPTGKMRITSRVHGMKQMMHQDVRDMEMNMKEVAVLQIITAAGVLVRDPQQLLCRLLLFQQLL